MKKRLFTILFLGLLTTTKAWALDTLESFDKGSGGVEFYLGYDGLGAKNQDAGLFNQNFQFDLGLTDDLTLYLTSDINIGNSEENRDAFFTLGAYYPVLDTDHFDIDLGFEVAANMLALNMYAKPYLELTFDLNEERTFGSTFWPEKSLAALLMKAFS